MRKVLGRRTFRTAVRAAFEARYYRAAINMFLTFDRPVSAFRRYIFASGDYPAPVRIRTPLGLIQPVLYSYEDMLTVNEIFCRGDYRCGPNVATVVDFGSNIGMSALYFLTRNSRVFTYLFEPLPRNADRLRKNLRGFESRYEFSEVAVALQDGEADFGWEESGRYGGIGLIRENAVRVPCKPATEILESVLKRHSEIDVLKIDTESLEREILLSLPHGILARIKNILIEVVPPFERNPIPLTHSYAVYGTVARFRRRE
jgi:FkbM family methyltransferase